jgi:hypothetical protein
VKRNKPLESVSLAGAAAQYTQKTKISATDRKAEERTTNESNNTNTTMKKQ